MRKYWSFFRIRLISGLAYRAAALAGLTTQFAWGGMYILLYTAYYNSGGSTAMEFSQLTSYVWLYQAFLALFQSWIVERDIFEAITKGGVAYELCRPIRLYDMWLAKNIAGRVGSALLRSGPILVVAFILPAPYGLSLPPDLSSFALFLLSMAAGLFVACELLMLLYILMFYTMNPNGFRIIYVTLVDFMSGGVIPIPLFPAGFRRIAELLPFGSMQNTPFRIYAGNLVGIELWAALFVQIFWVVALYALGRVLMSKTLRRVVVQGG